MTYIHHPAAYEAATHAHIINNARKTFLKNPDNVKAYEFICDNYSKNDFYGSLYDALSTYGKLTPKQVVAVLTSMDKASARHAVFIAKIAAENAASTFLGAVSDKMVFKAKLVKIIRIEGKPFSYYDTGITYLHIFKDEAGNTITYKGRSDVGAEGQVVEFKGTVKEHKEYNGCKQTVVQRPKVLSIEEKVV